MDLFIEGGSSEPLGGGTPWTLIPEAAGPPGLDEYIHRFSIGDHPFSIGFPCSFTAIPDGPATLLFGGVEPGPVDAVPTFINLDMPLGLSTGIDDWELPILIVATES